MSSDGRNGTIMARAGNSNATKSGMYTRDPFVILNCNKCGAKGECPKFEEGARCWYELNEDTPDLTTAEGILKALRRKVEADTIRFNRSVRFHTAKGNTFVDRDTTTLSNGLTRDLQVLAELSVRFGVIKADPDSNPTPATIINVQQGANVLVATEETVEKCQALKRQLDMLTLEEKRLELEKQS